MTAVPRTISRFRKELVEMDIEKAGFIMKGRLCDYIVFETGIVEF